MLKANILKAIKTLVETPILKLTSLYSGRNRVNGIGDALEKYIKDLFANTLNIQDDYKKIKIYNETFSYQGNQNNPPDLIIRGGDSIEVKKLQGNASALALNSSYPKSKLYSNCSMITEACRNCETWIEKDIVYIIGNTDDINIKTLWFVYGDCYAADKAIYERIKNTISNGLESIPNIELTETNELGKIKKVDPLGITDLRIRGMWSIFHPQKVFEYLPKQKINSEFKFYCVMREEKFNSFPQLDKDTLLELQCSNFTIKDLKIKNPNNPSDLINIKFMEFYYG
ncbi:MAG: NgoPII family restriction endonuclease [bacterium]